ncbi:PRTRC system ParB family protein [Acidovorax sp.]|uniref:PRTRC system ParB family protein n=1 Tax=Acidovorax sp. TaxID=1872122 RepID=UPI0027BAE03A|nr:PRTRC system ParB family protein [Acidovorax sp.]
MEEVVEPVPADAGELKKVKWKDIVVSGNPRKRFDPDSMRSLEASIRAQGLHTPVLLRELSDGRLELVAGGRRHRAFGAVYGPDGLMPALVRKADQAFANAAALTENIEREPMTPVEEAEGAAKMLADCKGDRSEAARRMGWSLPTLEKRLALMNASDKVRQALQDKVLNIGHAELLAACRKETQDSALDHLLKQEKMWTVNELRAFLEAASLLLEKAIFDKTDCGPCHHNSARQSALFGVAISDGRCTNKQCFDKKTDEQLEATAAGLRDEFQVVRIVRPGENLTVIPLVVDGPKGVGPDQALACRTCEHFGAAVSAAPDKLGKVFKNLCINVPCNTQHVDARKKEREAAEAQEAAAKEPGGRQEAGAKAGNGKAEGARGAKAPAAGAAKKATTASAEPSRAVQDYREKIWRTVFRKAVPKLPTAQNRQVLLAICITQPSSLDAHLLLDAIKEAAGEDGMTIAGSAKLMKLHEAYKLFTELESGHLRVAVDLVAAHVSTSMSVENIRGLLKTIETDLTQYWKLNSEFLTLLTKNEVDAVAIELGLKDKLGEGYTKARNGAKKEFIDAVLGIKDFEYRGLVPKMMRF